MSMLCSAVSCFITSCSIACALRCYVTSCSVPWCNVTSRHVVSCYVTSLCRAAVCHVTSRRVPLCHAVLSPAKQAEDIKIVTTVPSGEASAAVDQSTTYPTKGKLEYFRPCIQVSGQPALALEATLTSLQVQVEHQTCFIASTNGTNFTVSTRTSGTPNLFHRKHKWFGTSTNFTVSTSGSPNLLLRKCKWSSGSTYFTVS